ncbi:MAG TPA: galactofuranose ABC transporter, permease protein YjfF [Opitutaceae bacterium]|nr:galactofuranose ABC transporter, permease protein YjfF [Opitutaceae bacterium]
MKTSNRRNLPLLVTAAIFVALFVAAGVMYDGFFSLRVFVNLFTDTAVIGIAAVGMTLVIFSGGIDLSVGAVVGFTSIFTATLVEQHDVHPLVAGAAAVACGAALGAFMGTLIQVFRQPPFLVTLAGMFLARGGAWWTSQESTEIKHPFFAALSNYAWEIGGGARLPTTALVLVAVLAAGYVVAHHTRFGRNLLAIGGGEHSALLMGLPVGATKIWVYTLNGAVASLAGLVAVVYSGSGNPNQGLGLELDAIAVVVIGGTLLAGGRGHMLGTFCGVLIFGTIQSALLFDGRLSPAWGRIVVGLLLLGFILLQRTLLRKLR